MAKDTAEAPAAPKQEPRVTITMPPDGMKMSGDHAQMARGKKCRLTMEGTITGMSDEEYGRSLSMRPSRMHVEDLGADRGEDEAEPMTDMVMRMQKGKH